ncbi:DUF3005 domain-containing protein [Chitinasiproducens palmae]|uniref:DUF3005 domain-containing protein n=1 Tax=Chitinasiproducens palmae TaxID=1770053 RepID=A0A1H2PU16_9BURK|nr:DUF3005 domain-containing protein [Chitinasiproducens palmae]SDV50280.1 Protein of unknown function [Chitinasiproducens palmae]
MSNLENNPPRQEQEEQARKSPVKRPEHDTSHLSPGEVANASGGSHGDPAGKDHGGEPTASGSTDQPYGNETDHTLGKSKTIEGAQPRGTDQFNDNASDSTVDTDGKGRDARFGRADVDQVIVSNASTEDAVPTPPAGLGGIDSRPGGNQPAIMARDGSAVVYEGVVEEDDRANSVGQPSTLIDGHDPLPHNHARTSHRVKIVPGNEK